MSGSRIVITIDTVENTADIIFKVDSIANKRIENISGFTSLTVHQKDGEYSIEFANNAPVAIERDEEQP